MNMYTNTLHVLPMYKNIQLCAALPNLWASAFGTVTCSAGVVDKLNQGANTLRKIVLELVGTRISRMLINIDELFMFILVIRIESYLSVVCNLFPEIRNRNFEYYCMQSVILTQQQQNTRIVSLGPIEIYLTLNDWICVLIAWVGIVYKV